MYFFPRIIESLPPLPRQHSAAIGCAKKYQPIGVTVHSHCVESLKGSYSDGGEVGGLQWIVKKHNFSWIPCSSCVIILAVQKIFVSFELGNILQTPGYQQTFHCRKRSREPPRPASCHFPSYLTELKIEPRSDIYELQGFS